MAMAIDKIPLCSLLCMAMAIGAMVIGYTLSNWINKEIPFMYLWSISDKCATADKGGSIV